MLGFALAEAPPGVSPAAAAPAAVVPIYAATEDYETGFGETPENVIFPGALLSPLRLERSLLSDLLGGTVAVSYGEAELINVERGYDDVVHDFDIAGRAVTIKVGAAGSRYADFVPVYDGTAAGWHADDSKLIVRLRGWEFLLEVALETRTFLGTGDLNGTADLEGKRYPVPLGHLSNVTPVALIPTELLFMVYGGPVKAIPAVYVRGSVLTLAADYATSAALRAATIPAGRFATCLAEGLFRLAYYADGSGAPQPGSVTCDVQGLMDSSGTLLETTAQIVRHILLDRAKVAAERVPGFAGAPWQFGKPIGFWSGPDDEHTCADVLASLLKGCAGWGGFSRRGRFSLGAFRLPVGPAVATYTEAEIVSATALELPEAVTPPPWRWRIAYDRNWTTQESDLAGLVTEDRKKWLKEARRLAEAKNDATKAFYQKACDPDPVEGYFRDRADAVALAEELELLWRSPRGLYRLELRTQAFARDLADAVWVEYSRWRLTSGALGGIGAISEDAEDGKTEITILVA